MLARLLSCLLLVHLLLSAETTIRDTIRHPAAGGLFTGQLLITMPDLTYNGNTYRRKTLTVNVKAGALYVQLIPSTADPLGNSYRVQYVPADGSSSWVETWLVPETASELKIYQVSRGPVTPAPAGSVGLQQLAGARGNSGRALCSDGLAWFPCDMLVNPAFTPGDMLIRGDAGLERLAIGSQGGQILSVQAGKPAWGNLAQNQVKQHEGALSIAWGQIPDKPSTFTPNAHQHSATDVSSGTLPLARLPSLPADQVTSGQFAPGRIPAAAVTQHQAALQVAWNQIPDKPSLEAPLTFGGGLQRTGNNITCPTCGGSGGGGTYNKLFTGQSTVSIPFSDHGFPHERLVVDCYDAGGGRLEPDTLRVDPSTFAVTITFSPAQTGTCSVTGQAQVGRTLAQTFTGSSVTVPNVAQELGTPLFSWRLYDTAGYWVEPDSTAQDAAGNFTVYVSPSMSGRLVLVGR